VRWANVGSHGCVDGAEAGTEDADRVEAGDRSATGLLVAAPRLKPARAQLGGLEGSGGA
jgi:hypothetical protein